MFSIFKLLKNKVKKQLKYPLDKDTINEIFYKQNLCPGCEIPVQEAILQGPSGGGSINIKCSFCGSFFNEMGPFGIDRLYWLDHHYRHTLWATTMKITLSKAYTPFTPQIIQTWHRAIVFNKSFNE